MNGGVLEVVLGALVGGLGKTIIDHFIKFQRYKTDVRKGEIENDALLSGHWKILYDEVRNDNKNLQLRMDKLELENESLREKYIQLQHQINFK